MTHSAPPSPPSADLVFFQFGRFVIVGGLATALQYAIMLAFTVFGGVQPVLASSVGFVAAAVAGYTLNRRFTFRSDVDYLAGLHRFAITTGCGLGLNAVVMAAGMDLARMNYMASQIIATGVVLLWNFQANRLWTFSIRLAPGSTRENSP